MTDTRFPRSSKRFVAFARQRREFIARVLGALAAAVFPASNANATRLEPPAVWPSNADRRVAALGRRYAIEHPSQAREFVDWVEAQLPLFARWAAPVQKARIARERLLTSPRLMRDFERGDVVMMDGWVMARTEGAVAVYISRPEVRISE